jgi:PAS domain S-box-containing protein
MSPKKQTNEQVLDETIELKNRLEETEETLRAIQQYLVDAFVVTHSNAERVMTLSQADFPYRMMVESMNEGALTLIPDGTIFYCNPRFGEMVQMEPEKLIGLQFRDLILPEELEALDMIFKEVPGNGSRGQFSLKAADGRHVPMQLSVFQFTTEDVTAISIIATDITERIASEEKIQSLLSKLTMAEQKERQELSQILHDDLQQRLFAIRAQLALLKDSNNQDKDPVDFRATLDEVEGWLSDAIIVTRNLSIDLGPITLLGEGLTEAISWLCAHTKEPYGLQVELDIRQTLKPLNDQARILVFQSVRELIFNIIKHAKTSQAKVILEQLDDRARITVSDSGAGFDVSKIVNDPKSAHGLLMIQDRLNRVNASLEVTSAPGEGTQAVIEIPIEEQEV